MVYFVSIDIVRINKGYGEKEWFIMWLEILIIVKYLIKRKWNFGN